jgi:hypothetical protein
MSSKNERFALSRFSAAVSEVRAGEWRELFDDERCLINDLYLWLLLTKVAAFQA